MYYSFFEELFNTRDGVRVPKEECDQLRLTEANDNESFVKIHLPQGFGVRVDGNLIVSKLFHPNHQHIHKRCDFFLINRLEDGCELFVIELKRRRYKPESRWQLLTGIALAFYCIQLGKDERHNLSFLRNIKVYATLLTNTSVERFSTNMNEVQRIRQEFKRRCDNVPGLFCVNGHSITLEELRQQSFCASFHDSINLPHEFPPYLSDRILNSD